MESKQIQEMIVTGIPEADVQVDGDGAHFVARVICDRFEGMSLIKQHKMVYATLGDSMGGAIHALSIQTYTRESWKKVQAFQVS